VYRHYAVVSIIVQEIFAMGVKKPSDTKCGGGLVCLYYSVRIAMSSRQDALEVMVVIM
jgi:hypothetical protein